MIQERLQKAVICCLSDIFHLSDDDDMGPVLDGLSRIWFLDKWDLGNSKI